MRAPPRDAISVRVIGRRIDEMQLKGQRMLRHLLLLSIVGSGLLVLTALAGILGHRSPAQTPPSLSPLSSQQRTTHASCKHAI